MTPHIVRVIAFIAVPLAVLYAATFIGNPPETLIDASPASEALTCETHENPCDKIDCDKIDTKELT